ncbi:putative UDP-3-O-acyl-N-acetylglucosamine deacetylase 5 [Dichanthelium oligosanthes]|uniref:UDP-3-O-acyl-N-acetylglucosamine deacetylase n=1 Tax=Dichanthelium oligosanthes TaxID=888268 RepID=A0A1E5WFM8_9POAL|nr:putative UDP-3-O-acyl-N-acetylglucosamine deacetylase 5 [Dichanthelium oligosanthes]
MSPAAARGLKSISSAAFSWKPVSFVIDALVFENLYLKPDRVTLLLRQTGRPQQTLAAAVGRSGVGLHSGACVTARLLPTYAGEGRYFLVEGEEDARVTAEVGNAEPRSQLCTTLRRGEGGGPRVRTVEHLLSAMEALGVDNCRVEVSGGDEVHGRLLICHLVLAPNCQFVIQIEKMRGAGLIKGGSLDNAMVCSMSGGWLNPPVRFEDEPCRHKILDLIGDFSLLAQNGNQGFPIARIVAYKVCSLNSTNYVLCCILLYFYNKLAAAL